MSLWLQGQLTQQSVGRVCRELRSKEGWLPEQVGRGSTGMFLVEDMVFIRASVGLLVGGEEGWQTCPRWRLRPERWVSECCRHSVGAGELSHRTGAGTRWGIRLCEAPHQTRVNLSSGGRTDCWEICEPERGSISCVCLWINQKLGNRSQKEQR